MFAVVVLALLAGAPSAAAASPSRTILVKFERPAEAAQEIVEEGDLARGRTRTGVHVVELAAGESVAGKLAEYEERGDVLYAEPNARARVALTGPLDPRQGSQWALASIKAVDGWSIYPADYGSREGVTVAVVDTGVDSNHEDLNDGRMLVAAGASCVTPSQSCQAGPALDDHGHGTMVTGVVAAAANNGTGVAGAAFSSRVIPVKVLDASGSGSYAAISNGILWAAEQGARVINLSLGGSESSQTLCDAVTRATARGALVVVAAGNAATSAASYPAACPGAVGVAATDQNDGNAPFSNFGSPNVFLSAPGVGILSTYPGNAYQAASGTSIAAPFVTSLAALLFGQRGDRSPAEVKTVLAQTAERVGTGVYGADPYGVCGCTWSSSHGYGRIDVRRALAVLAPPAPAIVERQPATRRTPAAPAQPARTARIRTAPVKRGSFRRADRTIRAGARPASRAQAGRRRPARRG